MAGARRTERIISWKRDWQPFALFKDRVVLGLGKTPRVSMKKLGGIRGWCCESCSRLASILESVFGYSGPREPQCTTLNTSTCGIAQNLATNAARPSHYKELGPFFLPNNALGSAPYIKCPLTFARHTFVSRSWMFIDSHGPRSCTSLRECCVSLLCTYVLSLPDFRGSTICTCTWPGLAARTPHPSRG